MSRLKHSHLRRSEHTCRSYRQPAPVFGAPFFPLVFALLCAGGSANAGAGGDRTVTVPEQEPLNDSCPGQPVAGGTFIDPASLGSSSDWDYFTFTTTAGTPITLGTEDPGGSPYTDTIVDLFGACNNLLTTDGDAGPRRFSLIYRYPAPFTGTYSMRVHGGPFHPQPYRAFIFLGDLPTGACCVPTGECRLEDRVTCRQAEGIFHGEETPCDVVECPPPIANDLCADAVQISAPGSGELSGHLGFAHDDYDPWAPSCTGLSAAGKDVVYRVDLAPGDMVQLSYTQSETDASIYIVTDCNEVVTSCVAGADATGYQQVESLTYVATIPPPGACCFDGQACRMMTEQDCADAGGGFRGIWTDCDPNFCYMMQGACCFDEGGCIDYISPWQCEAMGGVYAGDGVMCYWQPCPRPTGACCLDGSCSLLSGQDCAWAGGLFLGEETSCDPDPCVAAMGACCHPNHTCDIRTSAACAAAGGIYQGNGISCFEVACGAETGACCLANSACMVTTAEMCGEIDAQWIGGDYGCTPNPCPSRSSGDGASTATASRPGRRRVGGSLSQPSTIAGGSRAQTYYVILDSSVEEYGGPWTLSYTITSASDAPEHTPTPAQASISGVPNPFTESTRILYGSRAAGSLRIEIFDASGRLVRRLVDEPGFRQETGAVVWDGRDGSGVPVPAGVYFARLAAGRVASSGTIIRID